MKICLAISTLSSGGAERNACLLANYLAKDNSVSFLIFQKSKKCFYKLDKNIKINNLNLLSGNKNIFFKIFNFIKRIIAIVQFLKKNKTDAIISFLETMNVTILISSIFVKGIKIKIISDRNNPQKSERPITILFFKFLFYRLADHLVLQTKAISKNYKFFENSKIKIIQNFITENIKVKKKYSLSKKVKIISVGRLEDQKGYDVLLLSLKYLKNKINFNCHIFGVGSHKRKILNTINKLDLSKNIKLKGVSKNILNLYHKYDIYVLSSKFEGYPNTLVEAISAKIVPISSDCDYGPLEIISNNKTGLIFKTNDSYDLYSKLYELIKNKSKYFKIVKNLKKIPKPKNYNINKLNEWKRILTIN